MPLALEKVVAFSDERRSLVITLEKGWRILSVRAATAGHGSLRSLSRSGSPATHEDDDADRRLCTFPKYSPPSTSKLGRRNRPCFAHYLSFRQLLITLLRFSAIRPASLASKARTGNLFTEERPIAKGCISPPYFNGFQSCFPSADSST